ncbi:serine hydrolase-domain-containing protein [Bisporella sp. PMI_857]|nr:serine hydrolase-domain-containing protein [Bisporella sp. PMI_857]
MRFLCLHGKGTNCEIMKLQTRALREKLPPSFEYEFIDGEEDSLPPKGMDLIYPGPYLQYASCAEAVERTLAYLEEVIQEDGPYDGIIGFSQGAAVAARLILKHQEEDPFGVQPFKLAVFLCSAGLFYTDSTKEYEEHMETASKIGIHMPTVHLIGDSDPHKPFGLGLIKLCSKGVSRIINYDMGHEIPRDKVVVEACRNGIEWAARLINVGT